MQVESDVGGGGSGGDVTAAESSFVLFHATLRLLPGRGAGNLHLALRRTAVEAFQVTANRFLHENNPVMIDFVRAVKSF